MATPIVHVSAGVIIASIYVFSVRNYRIVEGRDFFSLMLPAMFLACLPDIDLIYSYLWTGRAADLHFGITHTIFFAALVALLFRALSSFSITKYTGLVFALVLSHVVIDGLTGPSVGHSDAVGIKALAPFSDDILVSPVTLFRGVSHTDWFTYENFKTVLNDLFFVPFAFLFFLGVKYTLRKKNENN